MVSYSSSSSSTEIYRFEIEAGGCKFAAHMNADGTIYHDMSEEEISRLRAVWLKHPPAAWARTSKKNPLTSAVISLSYEVLKAIDGVGMPSSRKKRSIKAGYEEKSKRIRSLIALFYKRICFVGDLYRLKDDPLGIIERTTLEEGVKDLASVLDENNYTLVVLRGLLKRAKSAQQISFCWSDIQTPETDPMASIFKLFDAYYGKEQDLVRNVWCHYNRFVNAATVFLEVERDVLDTFQSMLSHYISETQRLAKNLSQKPFFNKICNEIQLALNQKIEMIKAALTSNVRKVYHLLDQKKIAQLQVAKDPVQIEAYLVRHLQVGERLQQSIIDYCEWYDKHFKDLLSIWFKAEAVMFYLFQEEVLSQAASVGRKIEEGFPSFLHIFLGEEGINVKNGLIRSLIDTRPDAFRNYMELNNEVRKQLNFIQAWNQHHRIFHLVGEFLEYGLETFHEAKEWFAQKALKESPPAEPLQELPKQLAPRPKRLSPSMLPLPEAPVDEPLSTEETFLSPPQAPAVSIQDALRSFIADVRGYVVNHYAKMALHNAMDHINDLFIEIASGQYVKTTHQLAEHLDTLLVSLSLAAEQVASFKVMETHCPQFQLDANLYLKHDLQALKEFLPEEIKGKMDRVITAVNGVENISRLCISGTSSTSGQRIIQSLNAILGSSEDENLSVYVDLQASVYSFIKNMLEELFHVFFQHELRNSTWEDFWKTLDAGILVREVVPLSSRLEETMPFIGRINDLSQCCVLSNNNRLYSKYFNNGKRLLTRLKARLYYAHESMDLRNFTQRTIYTIHMACWSIFIAAASYSGKIRLQGMRLSELSKNLWIWKDLVMGEQFPISDEEMQFCTDSKRMLSYIRYRRSCKTRLNSRQPLWSLGKASFSPVFQQNQEPGFSFQSGPRTAMDVRVYNATLRHVEAGLGLIQKVFHIIDGAK